MRKYVTLVRPAHQRSGKWHIPVNSSLTIMQNIPVLCGMSLSIVVVMANDMPIEYLTETNICKDCLRALEK